MQTQASSLIRRDFAPGSDLSIVAINRVDDAIQSKMGARALVEFRAHAGRWEAPERGSRRAVMLETALGLIGTPWMQSAAGGDFDNWTLIKRCADAAGCETGFPIRREGTVWGGVREAEARKALLAMGFREIRPERAEPGDVILFSMKGDAKFLGAGTDDDFAQPAILSEPGGRLSGAVARFNPKSTARMVHAYWARAVAEAWVTDHWDRRVLTAFTLDRGCPRPAAANDVAPLAEVA